MTDFVHLHLHTEYSLLDGACRVAEIPARAAALGQTAVAITDHGVMYGAVAFYNACKDAGIKPIIGCEVYVAKRSRFDNTGSGETEPDHLVLLVKNETGYRNLIHMVSKAFTEGFYRKPRIDMELLEEHHEGLICLSACLAGYIPRHIMSGDLAGAEEYAIRMQKLFGKGNFYLELQDQGIDGQRMVNECIAGISEHTGIPLVATNDVHYLQKTDAFTQSVMMCIQTNSMVADGRPIGFETDEYYMKSGDEMAALLGRFEGAVENTKKIADACQFDFTFGKTLLPKFDPPDGISAKDYLKQLAYEGLDRRERNGDILYDGKFSREDYKYRIEYELVVVSSMGYASYFLIVADFVNYAKSHGIVTGPGRGSGAGSLIAYLIGITEVDPVKFCLLFESFLNPQRVSMPDFDIDFCYRRRDEVIDYVADRYGKDHVSQIITFGTMAAKAALRDVGRVLGMAYAEVDAVVRALPEHKYGVTLKEAMEDKSFRALCDGDDRIRELVSIAMALEGMPRNASTHAAGVVITDRPVSEYVPLSVNNDTVVTQFDMDTVAKLGLLKFDFLALRYLTIMDDTEREIRKNEPDFDINAVPFDDAETYALIASGKTDGLFQLESEGMRQLLVQMQPDCITDIMIAIALYRPGPMDAIPKFLRNRKDRSKLTYRIPCLAEILDETCGCIVYQEQVMQIFREVAGYSYGKADIVRRAIAKKKPGVIEKERESFLKGAVEKGYDRADADALYGEMTDFANYGFKKSHAAAYAFISYRTAYLKAHYAPMYYAALITSVFGNQPKMTEYITECAKMGIKTLPPDINESENGFSVSNGNIRYGLPAIKNVGDAFIRRVVTERSRGKFKSFYDFLSRMQGSDLNRRQIESLIKAGAFDSLGVYRSQLLAACGEMIESIQSKSRGNLSGQMDMFAAETVSFRYPDIPEFTLRERLLLEKESAGMYLSGHILDDYSRHFEWLSPASVRGILDSFAEGGSRAYREKQVIRAAGMITRIAQKNTKNGDVMAFAVLEDRGGEIELIIFPKVLAACGAALRHDAAVTVEAEISLKDGDPKLIVRSAAPLEANDRFRPVAPAPQPLSAVKEYGMGQPVSKPAGLPIQAASEPTSPAGTASVSEEKNASHGKLWLKVPDMEGKTFARVLALCEIFSGGTPLVFYDLSRKKYITAGIGVDASEFLANELKGILGEDCVVLR
ncbi:MAG: DNA polymerase III subunit alpha [Ruminococcaceae bacterium]|nr:DNA polymerase III subunit alpha [Oscillospiraceae bacterium]